MPSIKDYQPTGFKTRLFLFAGRARHYVANICDMVMPFSSIRKIQRPPQVLTQDNLTDYRGMIDRMGYAWVNSEQRIILHRGINAVPNKKVTIKHYGASAAGNWILRYLLDKYDEYSGQGLNPEYDPITVDVTEYKKGDATYRAISFTLSLDKPAQTRRAKEFSFFQITVAERKELGRLFRDTLAVAVRPVARMAGSLMRRVLGRGSCVRWATPIEGKSELRHQIIIPIGRSGRQTHSA